MHGPYEPTSVYEAYYVWVLAKRWWTLDDYGHYLSSGRSRW